MALAFAIGYLIGAVVMAQAVRRRAGITHWGRIDFRRDGVGPVWLAKGAVQTMFWPVTAIMWAVRARSR